jgi:hypothetical protein
MLYNGSFVDLNMVNPGNNNVQQAFLRFCNPGTVAGEVVVQGWDDAGTAAASTTAFTLAAGECKQFLSADLEAGSAAKGLTGALGTGNGKWRMRATAEFDNLVGYSFIRNTQAGDVYDVSSPSSERSSAPAYVFDGAVDLMKVMGGLNP